MSSYLINFNWKSTKSEKKDEAHESLKRAVVVVACRYIEPRAWVDLESYE